MKIGILTLPLHTNYGGILQAYALQTVLERMGHEVNFISPLKYPVHTVKQKIKKNLSLLAHRIKVDYIVSRIHGESYIMVSETKRFIDKYLNVSDFPTISAVKEDSFDAIVVGSDQVWRPLYFGEKRMEHAFLAFAKDWKIKRVAYAASFGSDKWELNEGKTIECRNLAKRFDAISVREKSGLELCRTYLHVDAQWVFDPTMLLDAENYNKLLDRIPNKNITPNILTYIIDRSKEKEEIISLIRESKKMPVCISNSRAEDTSGIEYRLEQRIQPPVESWLWGFKNASFVVTDSFHACIFSVLYQKQFYVVANRERGVARIQSLLASLGLEDRLVYRKDDVDLSKVIDYNRVNRIVSERRDISLAFIKNNLS